MAGLIGNGKRFNFTATGACTKDTAWTPAAGGFAGVYMKTGVTGDLVPVALEGTFNLAGPTGNVAAKKFVPGDMVYAVVAGGALTNVRATGTAVPLGMYVGLAATTSAAGATPVHVKLTRFGTAA